MLEGLRAFLDKTQGQSAIMRSAVAAFGFVYIHPLADGNGRVHRFLVNDILRRHARACAALKEVVEMPDQQADRVLRSLEHNQGKLSHALSKEIPVLALNGVWDDIVGAVSRTLQEER